MSNIIAQPQILCKNIDHLGVALKIKIPDPAGNRTRAALGWKVGIPLSTPLQQTQTYIYIFWQAIQKIVIFINITYTLRSNYDDRIQYIVLEVYRE